MSFLRLSILVMAFLVAIAAHADDPPRLVLAAADLPAEIGARLRAELGALGFEVVAVAPDDERPLGEIAVAEQAAFALSVAPRDGGYELWLRDRVTSKTVVREILRHDDALALRAVELIRASLLELRAGHEVAGELAADEALSSMVAQTLAPPEIAPPARGWVHVVPPPYEPSLLEQVGAALISKDRTATATLEVGILGLYDGGGTAGAFGFEVAGGWFDSRTAQVRLIGRYHGTSLELPEGHVALTVMQVGASAAFHLVEPTAAFSPFFEWGHLGTIVQIEGEPSSPALAGKYDVAFAVQPFIASGLTAGAPSFPLRFRGSLGMGLTLPEVRLMVRGQEAASWGFPLLFGNLSAQYVFQ